MALQQPDSQSLDDAIGPMDIDVPYGESMDHDIVASSFFDASFNDLPNELGFQDRQMQLQMPHDAGSQLAFPTARSISENVPIDPAPFNTYYSSGQSNGHGPGSDSFQVEPSNPVNTSLEPWSWASSGYVTGGDHQQYELGFTALGAEVLQHSQNPPFDVNFSSPHAPHEPPGTWDISLESPTDLAQTWQQPSTKNTAGSSNPGHRKNQSLPKAAVEILETWFNANRLWPYPTSQEKSDLAKKTGLKVSQVSNWFTNSRSRKRSSDSSHGNVVTDHCRGRSTGRNSSANRENSCSSIRSTSLSVQRTGRDRSPRRGRKRSISVSGDRSTKRTRSSSCSGTEPEDDAFPCTVCWAAVSRNFASWKRHEQEFCLRLRSWTCPSASPTYGNGGNICVFCNGATQFGLCNEDHRIMECSNQEENARTFYRKSHLAHHFKNFHKGAKLADEVAALCMRHTHTAGTVWPCGFCSEVHPDFDTRAKHVFQHLREGKTKEDWSDPEASVNLHVPEVSNPMRSQPSVLKEASKVPQSEPFQSEIPRNASRPTDFPSLDSPRTHTNSLFAREDESNENHFFIGQRRQAVAVEQSENGRGASIREHQPNQERPDSPLSDFRTLYICGDRGGMRDGNSWGCHRPFQGIIALAKHFVSPVGKICIVPLYGFDERETDIELSVGGEFEDVSNADATVLSTHRAEPNIRPSEGEIYFWRPLTNRNSSEELRLPRFLFLKYPALAAVNWRDLPSDDEIDLFAMKFHGPLSTIISMSSETRSVKTQTLPSHQVAAAVLSTDHSANLRQRAMSPRLSAPPSFPDSPRAPDSPSTAGSPSLSLPPIPYSSLVSDDLPYFILPPSETQLMIRDLELDERPMWDDVEMSISELESTTADYQDDDGDNGSL